MEWFVDEPHRGEALLRALTLLAVVVGLWLGRRQLLLTSLCALVFLIIAAMAIPSIIPAKTSSQRMACTFHLRAIADAKSQWARENAKLPTAIPSEADLYGEAQPLRHKLECPRGGRYVIGAVNENPTCSFADKGHKL